MRLQGPPCFATCLAVPSTPCLAPPTISESRTRARSYVNTPEEQSFTAALMLAEEIAKKLCRGSARQQAYRCNHKLVSVVNRFFLEWGLGTLNERVRYNNRVTNTCKATTTNGPASPSRRGLARSCMVIISKFSGSRSRRSVIVSRMIESLPPPPPPLAPDGKQTSFASKLIRHEWVKDSLPSWTMAIEYLLAYGWVVLYASEVIRTFSQTTMSITRHPIENQVDLGSFKSIVFSVDVTLGS